LLLITLIFTLLLLIPFIPSIKEYLNPKDIIPLEINFYYSRNPRYFSESFKKKLKEKIKIEDIQKALEGTGTLEFNEEEVKIHHTVFIEPKTEINKILYVLGNLKSGEDVIFRKEVYVKGNAYIGDNNQIRAIACEEEIHLGKNTKIIRWVDAEKDILTKEDCDLGVSITSNGKIMLGKKCKFKRVYAKEISTHTIHEEDKEEKDAYIKGNIKTYDNLTIKGNIEIDGNVFGEKDIYIGENVHIKGNVFSQGKIILEDKSKIGEEGKIKSIIAKKGIYIKGRIKVYGFMMTEGEGIVN